MNEQIKDKNINKYLYSVKIYISGEILNCENSKINSNLEDNYDLMCYNSKLYEDVAEVKLVVMMGSRLMIVMFQNNDIQKREINTAKKLKIPILFIYNSLDDKQGDTTNEREYQIVFKNFEDVAMILKDSFKLIKKITKRKNLPFKTLQNKTKLFNIFKINSISILKEKNQLILLYYKIRCYCLNGNTLKTIQSHELMNAN